MPSSSPPTSTPPPAQSGPPAGGSTSGQSVILCLLPAGQSILQRVEPSLLGWKPPAGWHSRQVELIDLRTMTSLKLHIRRSQGNGEIFQLKKITLSPSATPSKLWKHICSHIRRLRTQFNHLSDRMERLRLNSPSQFLSKNLSGSPSTPRPGIPFYSLDDSTFSETTKAYPVSLTRKQQARLAQHGYRSGTCEANSWVIAGPAVNLVTQSHMPLS